MGIVPCYIILSSKVAVSSPQTEVNTPKLCFREDTVQVSIDSVRALAASLSISEITARLLCSRGVQDTASAKAFLYPTLREHLPDPGEMKNLNEAASLILQTVREKKLITIYTDFDVDGLTSGSQLYLFLEALKANVATFVPNRFVEGYGLESAAIRRIADAGTSLLVTVDCGISNHKEIELAKRLGMAVVVLDHHEPGAYN